MSSCGTGRLAGSGSGPAALWEALVSDFFWTPSGEVQLKFLTYHPRGMVKIGKFIYLSSVKRPVEHVNKNFDGESEITRGHDCASDLFKADLQSNLIAQTELG